MKVVGSLSIVLTLCGFIVLGCGSKKTFVQDNSKKTEDKPVQSVEVEKPRPPGQRLNSAYLPRADVLYLIEKASLWRRDLSPKALQELDDKVGLEPSEREKLRKFALLRVELADRAARFKPRPSFEDPFGSEGLFPLSSRSVVDHFWNEVLSVDRLDRLSEVLKELAKPLDTRVVGELIFAFMPRLDELKDQNWSGAEHAKGLSKLLHNENIRSLLDDFARFLEINSEQKLAYSVHPVWMPETTDREAIAYGDRVLVTVSDNERVGAEHAILAIHEVGRRLMSLIANERKASYTRRFVEKAGYDGKSFYLTEGVLDAFSYGLVAPVLASVDKQTSLAWPGDASRKRYSEALVPLLRQYLSEKRSLDAGFVNRAADLCEKFIPPKPADYLDGAMVIGREQSIQAFKTQVVRWTVWKFPLSKKYNYNKKLTANPGKTILLLATPSDFGLLRTRLKGISMLDQTLDKFSKYIENNKLVFKALGRSSRGYVFLLAAPEIKRIKKLARVFLKQTKIPDEVVILD